ncbi:YVTN family beta-propeller repeat protein, partial [Kitasatospora sp. NPDC001574]
VGPSGIVGREGEQGEQAEGYGDLGPGRQDRHHLPVDRGGQRTAHRGVGQGRFGAAVAPGGGRAYVTSQSSGVVTVLDTAGGAVTGTVTAGTGSYAVAFAPDGGHAYLTHHLDGTVSVVDTATAAVTATVPVGAGAFGVAVAPDGAHVYVAASGAQQVDVIDTATRTVSATVPVGHGVFGLALAPDGSRLWTANGGDSTVSVLSTATNTVTATVQVGANPYAVTVAPDGRSVYASNYADSTLSVLDAASGAVTATVPVGANPFTLALAPDGRRGYLADFGGDTVTVLGFPLPVPVVTGISPASGPQAGGTVVTVTGTDLSGATAVSFGAAGNAASFSCTDTACTATAPASAAAGTVDVRVTTPGGTSAVVTADRFEYQAPAADLGVALAATPVPGLFGGRVDYTLTLTNNGPGQVTAATVTSSLPAGFGSYSGDCAIVASKLTCALTQPLAVGASVTRHFTVQVGLLNLGRTFTVTTTRTAGAPVDTAPANDAAARTCRATLGLLISCD